MSQYLIGGVLQAIRAVIDRAGVQRTNPLVYQTFLANVETPNSALQLNLFEFLDRQTQQQWRQGSIHHDALFEYLRPWIRVALSTTEEFLIKTGQMQPVGAQQYGAGYQPPQQMGYSGYTPAHALNTTSGLYGEAGSNPPPVPAVPTVPNLGAVQFSGDPLANINLGRDVVFELHRASPAELRQTDGGILTLDNHQKGSYENDTERLTTIEITLNVAQNNPRDAALRVFNLAPQEVVRGAFANVIRYRELFHLPIAFATFVDISAAVGEAYYKEKDNWRNALNALEARNRSEWSLMNNALTKLLNISIRRRLRTSTGNTIDAIESIEDLNGLDDRHSKFTVTHHARYWPSFNALVAQAFDNLFDPANLIKPEDINFGDFIHCDQVEIFADGRSKYDYGTFAERLDKEQFITRMLGSSTVLRIPRTAILTNAIDPRIVNVVEGYQNREQMLLSNMQTIGTALLDKLDYPRRGEVEAVLCLDKGTSPDNYFHRINLGRTLDDDLVLIR